jgi:amidase
MKPTVGLVSRAGVIPISHTLDSVHQRNVPRTKRQVGPMAKSSYDIALILSVIAGRDPLDPKSFPFFVILTVAFEIPENAPTDYTQFTKHATFRGMRLGVPRDLFFAIDLVGDQEIIDAVNAAILKIQSLGATIQDPANLPSTVELRTSTSQVTILRRSILVCI